MELRKSHTDQSFPSIRNLALISFASHLVSCFHSNTSDYESLGEFEAGLLLFFGVIHQISRSHGLKNRRFESNLSKITRPVAAIKSLRFALFKFWHYFHLVKQVQFGVSGHFPENALREWLESLHADAFWPPELIMLWSQSVDFSNFGTILT